MLSKRLKKRLTKDHPMTSITLRIPVNVVESMKEIALHKGFTGYQTLLKSYISEGLRNDETRYLSSITAQFIAALKKHGVRSRSTDSWSLNGIRLDCYLLTQNPINRPF